MTTVSQASGLQKITPFLWYDGKAEEAARFYASIFKNAKVGRGGPLVTEFELEGMKFYALNGGPQHPFTEAVSFMVSCDTQEEIDYFWEALSAGGEEVQCGWLKDRYGLRWQIVPPILIELIHDEDPVKADRVMQAMLKMIKLDIAALKAAYEGGSGLTAD